MFGLAMVLLAFCTAPAWGQWEGSGDIYYNNGNVGIGLDSPSDRLHVVGNSKFEGAIREFNWGGGIGLKLSLVESPGSNNAPWIFWDARNAGSNYVAGLRQSGNSFYLKRYTSFYENGKNILHAELGSGNVGIGTTQPAHKLSVSGSVKARESLRVRGGDWDLEDGGDIRIGSGANHVKMATALGGSGGGDLWLTTSEEAEGGSLNMGVRGSTTDLFVAENHRVGIGTPSPSKKLTVKGNVLAEEVIVDPEQIPDYVFNEDYDLPTLEEVSAFIDQNGHLPDVPSAESVEKNGLRLGGMDATLLRKIEELTLYAIEQKKRADSLASRTDALTQIIQRLRSRDEVQHNRNAAQQKQIGELKRQNEKLRKRLEQLEQRLQSSSDNR